LNWDFLVTRYPKGMIYPKGTSVDYDEEGLGALPATLKEGCRLPSD
jgi:hypothetical protein